MCSSEHRRIFPTMPVQRLFVVWYVLETRYSSPEHLIRVCSFDTPPRGAGVSGVFDINRSFLRPDLSVFCGRSTTTLPIAFLVGWTPRSRDKRIQRKKEEKNTHQGELEEGRIRGEKSRMDDAIRTRTRERKNRKHRRKEAKGRKEN